MCRKVQLRRFASLLGFIQSCARALGKVVRLMTRASYHWMTEKLAVNPSYNMFYQVPEEVKHELFFWESNIQSLNGHEINPSQSLTETRLIIVMDASTDRRGVYLLDWIIEKTPARVGFRSI